MILLGLGDVYKTPGFIGVDVVGTQIVVLVTSILSHSSSWICDTVLHCDVVYIVMFALIWPKGNIFWCLLIGLPENIQEAY